MKRNAIILAAGTSSRFVPLSLECPKGLLEVKGEILIERQIRQLQAAGITDITVVVGYKASMFSYLEEKFGVNLVYNEDYARYNNTSSMIRVLDRLNNTFICSSDNYFPHNVFNGEPNHSFYSALYAEGHTDEYCIGTDKYDNIKSVTVGGDDSWFMVGHVYFNNEFSKCFKEILEKEYDLPETRAAYWEDVYIRNINVLPPMKINRYHTGEIAEFDSLDELRVYDHSYLSDTRSKVLKSIAGQLGCSESSLHGFNRMPSDGEDVQFTLWNQDIKYLYKCRDKSLIRL